VRPTLYPAKVHGRLNDRTFRPEAVDRRAMVNPHYPCITDAKGDPGGPPLLPGTLAISDSGAFQQRDMEQRCTPDQALDRQLALEQRLRDDGCGPDFALEALVTYDMLVGVDEALVDGKRVKRRGNEETAAEAVRETIRSAELYHRRRDEVAGSIAYSAQGASLRQYLSCVRALLDLIRPGRDWLALGGFCIIGMVPSLKPLFVEVCREVAPLARRKGVARVHFLGVAVDDAVTAGVAEFGKVGVPVSLDTSSIEFNSVMGREWREENRQRPGGKGSPWRQVHDKAAKIAGHYHPVDLTIDNLRRYSAWLASQGPTSSPLRPIPPMQRPLDLLDRLEGATAIEALLGAA
jgi:hypothetical protein